MAWWIILLLVVFGPAVAAAAVVAAWYGFIAFLVSPWVWLARGVLLKRWKSAPRVVAEG